MGKIADKFTPKFKADRTPSQVFGSEPWLLVRVTTDTTSDLNQLLGDYIRVLGGAYLHVTGIDCLPGGSMALTYGALAGWHVSEPVKAAETLKTALEIGGLLFCSAVAWWDHREGVFREVHSIQGKTFNDYWPEIDVCDFVAVTRAKMRESES